MTSASVIEPRIWIAVIQRGRATVFCSHGRRTAMRVVSELEDDAGRLHTRSLPAAHGSGAFELGGHAGHALSAAAATREQELALQLARRLDQAGIAAEFDQLILIASPGFLSRLRKLLSAATRRRLMLELAKEVLDPTAETVRRQLSGLARV
jgi:protein required for attachment to host cells